MKKLLLGSLACTIAVISFTGSLSHGQDKAARPSPRRGHVLAYDLQQKKVLLLDGYQRSDQLEKGEIWGWSGQQWKLLATDGPASRSLSGLAYDTKRNRLVLFGGVGKTGYDDLKGDTWEWDGNRWHSMTDTSIGTRDHHVMVYDAARGKTVLYGGQTSARAWAKDTWEWDGVKWSKLTTPGPGGRAHFAMAYDNKRQRVVLFGGLGEDNRYHNDTWEWDGATWRKVSDAGPPARARHRMAFDSRAGIVILYGGDGVKTEPGPGFRVLDDLWTWDGARWTEIKTTKTTKTTGPGPRFVHALAYDAARHKTVLYGGGDGQKTLDDTWEWDGKTWGRKN